VIHGPAGDQIVEGMRARAAGGGATLTPVARFRGRVPSAGIRLIYGERCSNTRFRFVRNPLFCLGSIIPIIGDMIFIHPDTLIWT
jgi:hypothetical protein